MRERVYSNPNIFELNITELRNRGESDKLLNFIFEMRRRGKLRFNNLLENLHRIKRRFFQKEVGRHEVGHARVARSYGWTVHEINITGRGDAAGFVRVSPPPDLPIEDVIRQKAVIALSGEAGLGSSMGTASDYRQSAVLNEEAEKRGIKNIVGTVGEQASEASRRIGSLSSVEDEAYSHLDEI